MNVGTRVQIHAASARWMMGDRYGEITKIGRKFVSVKLDKSGKTIKSLPDQLQEVY
jgi:hypothetical protein